MATTFPKPEDCCGGALLHEALRRQFDAMVLHPDWPAPAGVRAAVTTREGPEPTQRSAFGFNVGMRCGDDPLLVARNRAFLREALQLPSDPRWLQQVHGTRVVSLDSRLPDPLPQVGEGDKRAGFSPLPLAGVDGPHTVRTGEGKIAKDSPEPQADAAVTRAAGVVLVIQTADCLPVLFCADDGSEVAAAHAGWRGLAAGVLEATLAAMATPRERILAWLGPAIAAPSYEVGEEVRAAFVAHAPAAASAFAATRPGHFTCDLYALASQRLRAAGVAHVAGGGFDTFTDARLHSYRRDGAVSGRMASLVWIAP